MKARLTSILILALFLACGAATAAAALQSADSLMTELRATIANRPLYIEQKEDRLTELRQNLASARDDDARFMAMGALLDEFRPYNTDSALAWCRRRELLAQKLGSRDYAINAALNRANVYGSVGMYKEAFEITDSIADAEVPEYLKPYFFYIKRTVFSNLADYTIDPGSRRRYIAEVDRYRDSIIARSAPGSLTYVINLADRYNARGESDRAVGLLDDFLASGDYTIHDRAICAYTLAEAYGQLGDTERRKQNLILSSIADQQAAVREYVSLRQLALLLFREGDIANAHDFLRVSIDDAQKCNARLRLLELNDIFPIVNEAYVSAIEKQKTMLAAMIAVICLLVIFLLFAMRRISRQMKQTARANSEVRLANDKLTRLNAELHEANAKLKEANRAIAENSEIKEEYIARFMDQCSLYIEKIDAYRKQLNKLYTSGRTDELKKALKSTELMDDELKAFYANFDSTFLKLFPNFVEEFNRLLAPEERIVLKKEGQLNTELRIFALIRLGIADSVKIAQFLRYSVTTIYNYRTKTRNKAAGDRSRLEDDVMRIGRVVTAGTDRV